MADLWEHLDRLFALTACFLLAASILFPFVTITHFTIIPELNFRLTYWSFQVVIVRGGLSIPQTNSAYFDEFWFAHGEPYSYQTPSDFGISLVFVALFLIQLFTLCFGALALFKDSTRHMFIPFLSSLSVFFLMIYMTGLFVNRTHSPPTYEIGLWFTALSMSLFFVAYVLRSTATRKKKAD